MTFLEIMKRIGEEGKFSNPRGMKIAELEDFSGVIDERFMNFPSRKLSLKYIRAELLWYLRAKADDLSILEHASIWKDLVQPGGHINSNYGAQLFPQQFSRAIAELEKDPDSRRASMVILNFSHLLHSEKDIPCTYGMNFRIRDNKLNMSVHMRSQDAIFGMGNDIPFFSVLQEMVYCALLAKYPGLALGRYHHSVDSLHVYERHWGMLDRIRWGEGEENEPVRCPRISGPDEVEWLLCPRLQDSKLQPDAFRFSRWLTEDL